ncbi:MAG: YitT family protein, partial [Bacillota bacterium]|nr:YitT family protein [Bacillota bacterium]
VSGLSIFIRPNDLLSGGVWGLSMIIEHFWPGIPLGFLVALLNIPLLIWGWQKMHLRFALYTIYTIILQSLFMIIGPEILPVYTEDRLLACLFGGAMIGLGSGIIVRFHGSAGGSDIVGLVIKERMDVSIGSVTMSINAAVVLCSSLVFGISPALYTLVQLFISSSVFTKVLNGFNSKRNMMIVTEKGAEISQRLQDEVGRGVTILKGIGGYSRTEKDVLFCVLSRFELSPVKDIIRELDPQAFVSINDTHDVMGAFPRRGLSNPHCLQELPEKQAEADKKEKRKA